MLTPIHDPIHEPPPLSRPGRPAPAGVWNAALIGIVVVVSAVLGWRQRWISDDGLIVLRTVRQLLAGHGPVFNIGERVETNTSTAWTFLLALVGWLPGVRLEQAMVVLGVLCAAAGLGLGVDAARRLHLPRGGAVLVPVGVVILLALPPMRDFLSSGLETGLITLWLAGTWWLLVVLARRTPRTRHAALPWLVAVVLGCGPLVRPDLGVFTLLGLLVLIGLLRPRWGRLLGLIAAAEALPVGYEIFRAGYYGLLVPNTALAKEAARPRWTQGVYYLHDTVATYWLWVPLAGGLVVLAGLIGYRCGDWSERWATVLVTLQPMVAGLLMALFVVRVGGDFMHGRMLLPAITALLLPVLAVPLTVRTLVPVLGVAVWAGVCVGSLRVEYGSNVDLRTGIVDERAFWSEYAQVAHPLQAADFIRANWAVRTSVAAVAGTEPPAVMFLQGGRAYAVWRPFPARAGVDHVTISYLNLGMMAAAHPLTVRVVDGIGLANPLGSHATSVFGARVGHDKDLPLAWYIADEVRPDVQPPVAFPLDVRFAHAALRCPRIAELLDSVRAPLTPQRFWANLTGSVARTTLRFSRIPERAATCS